MNILAIDTSTKVLSLAVARGEKTLKFKNVKLARPLSTSIMPSIKTILDSSGISLQKLDGFAVGLGPGSFTSLRVGLSTIKGLAFATGKPIVGISSLDILAMNVPGDKVQICAVCDAKRKLVYSCLYEKKGSVLKKKFDYTLDDIHGILKKVKGVTTFIGDGCALFKDDIKQTKGITPVFSNGKSMYPQARNLIPLALGKFQKGKHEDINKLVPLYLYPEHCQVKKS